MSTTAADSGGDDIVRSTLLGDLQVPAGERLVFPAGLYGFEERRAFALVPAGRASLLWLQSVERADLVFLLADPFVFFPGYEVDVPEAEAAELGAPPESAPMALVIVTLPSTEGVEPTANLRAPLVIDPARRIGRQVVLLDDALSLTATIAL